MSEPRNTVFVVDDDSSLRRSLELMLTEHGWAVESFETGRDFLDRADRDAAGCVVLDQNLPGMDGLEVQRQMDAENWVMPVVFLTGFGTVDTAVSAMKTGATTYLSKPVDPDALVAAVQEALTQCETRRSENATRSEVEQRLEKLTPREMQVVDMIVEGKRTKQIAAELFISVKTVETHRDNIMKKLGATNVAEVVRIVTTRNMLARRD